MSHWVDPVPEEPLPNMGVPIVLDLVVSSPEQASSYSRPLIAQDAVQLDDGLFFLERKPSSLDVWSQIVSPAEATTLPTSLKPGVLGKGPPVTRSMSLNIVDELEIFLRRPWPFLEPILVTARRSSHRYTAKQQTHTFSWVESGVEKGSPF